MLLLPFVLCLLLLLFLRNCRKGRQSGLVKVNLLFIPSIDREKTMYMLVDRNTITTKLIKMFQVWLNAGLMVIEMDKIIRLIMIGMKSVKLRM